MFLQRQQFTMIMTFDAIASVLLFAGKSTHYPCPLKPNKIRTEDSMHKDTRGSGGVTGKTFPDMEKNNKNNKKTHEIKPRFRLGLATQ